MVVVPAWGFHQLRHHLHALLYLWALVETLQTNRALFRHAFSGWLSLDRHFIGIVVYRRQQEVRQYLLRSVDLLDPEKALLTAHNEQASEPK